MPRLIDADALVEDIEDWYNRIGETMNLVDTIIRNVLSSVMDNINKAPTIDAEPVVRCKDCQERCPNSGVSVQHCTLSGIQTEDDDFCSYGVRKGEMHG